MDLSNIFKIIKNGNHKRISIQLPEASDVDPSLVMLEIKNFIESNKIDCKIYLLGDVASGDCCVDRIAAKRCNSDLIIHHGYWCHTPYTNSCSIYHNYISKPFDLDFFVGHINMIRSENNISIIYDPCFHHLLPDIVNAVSDPSIKIYKCFSEMSEIGESHLQYNRIGTNEGSTIMLFLGDSYYIDRPYPLLYKIALEISASTRLDCLYNSGLAKENLCLKNEICSKRFTLIEKIKNATRIGICTGTSSLQHANELRKKLNKVVNAAGKQSFSFILGKINAMKLENFDSIDIFCPLLCPESILRYIGEASLSEKVLNRKIVFPFELLVALGYLPWSDEYIFDFGYLLRAECSHTIIPITKSELACTSQNVYNLLLDNNERCFRGVELDYNTGNIPNITEGLCGTASKYTKDIEN